MPKKVKVEVKTVEIEIPDAPPKGYGADATHKATAKEADYLQKCWDKETDQHKVQIVQDTAHLNPAEV